MTTRERIAIAIRKRLSEKHGFCMSNECAADLTGAALEELSKPSPGVVATGARVLSQLQNRDNHAAAIVGAENVFVEMVRAIMEGK